MFNGLKKLFTITFSMSLLLSLANPTINAAAHNNDQLFFSTQEEIKDQKLLSNNSNVRVTKFNSTLPDINDYSSFAYDVKDVEADQQLKFFLQEALEKGKKVYLYGGVTPSQYEELLHQSIKIKISDGIAEEKTVTINDLKEADGKSIKQEFSDSDSVQDVIGYTTQETPLNALLLKYSNRDDTGAKIPNTSSIILDQILKHEVQARNSTISPRGSTVVKSSTGDIRVVFGLYGIDKAEMVSQWMLYKGTDSDSVYDYFTLKDLVQLKKIDSSFKGKNLIVSHTLAYSSDELYDAQPKSTSSGPYTVTFEYPFSIGWSFTIPNNPNITLDENWNVDKASWAIDGSDITAENKYQLGTSWKSTGTIAGINVYHFAELKSGINVWIDDSQQFSISYDY
ncbi:hypothetical protein [Paenibacillus glacialis]|uniref:Uncharacterized protein n=1 Tax=Paenibacillus glacialis TaxID=494026 RepID=A0A168KPU6_9BACL|nr:hypothetical protein [Paenibacillus glacialis]OAB42309.1 hypothetical protein PGLA_13505 [Paenibacillus glacialis]